jgi:SAM-dependent methyltransferase
MHDGLATLDAFYASPRGEAASAQIRAVLCRLWPSLHGLSLLGLGYAEPYLSLWLDQAARVAAMATPDQGARAWPPARRSVVSMGQETALPFADRAFDRVLMVHALEAAEHSRRAMREVWRVLADGGRLVVVVPNRRGMWAHLEGTPFGHGRPYSAGQLRRLCEAQMFTPLRQEDLLFVPPFPWRPLLRGVRAWDAAGRALCPGFAGLVVLEAEKTVLAPLTIEEASPVRRTVPVAEVA